MNFIPAPISWIVALLPNIWFWIVIIIWLTGTVAWWITKWLAETPSGFGEDDEPDWD
jgi:hypothetical protein